MLVCPDVFKRFVCCCRFLPGFTRRWSTGTQDACCVSCRRSRFPRRRCLGGQLAPLKHATVTVTLTMHHEAEQGKDSTTRHAKNTRVPMSETSIKSSAWRASHKTSSAIAHGVDGDVVFGTEKCIISQKMSISISNISTLSGKDQPRRLAVQWPPCRPFSCIRSRRTPCS